MSSMDELRERILRTASELFDRGGAHAGGVNLVVERAGVPKPSLYRHFRTKDDLIAAFLEREDEQFWGKWDKIAALHPSDAQAELDAHMEWVGERLWPRKYRGCSALKMAGGCSTR